MYGLFQTTFYFGYMALFSIALGILCGKCSINSNRVYLLRFELLGDVYQPLLITFGIKNVFLDVITVHHRIKVQGRIADNVLSCGSLALES